jgi:hypothetical protein
VVGEEVEEEGRGEEVVMVIAAGMVVRVLA